VKRKFASRADAERALAEVEGAAPDSPEVAVLATHLAEAENGDPEFAAELRRTWETSANHGGVVNQITGTVSGKVVQARDVHGDISF
jgi:hypothetical protein